MKSFDDWVMESPATPLNQKPALPEGVYETAKGDLIGMCRRCDCFYVIDWDIEEGFDPDMSYCGRSERCCP